VAHFGALRLSGWRAAVADRIVREVSERLRFLADVGLDYLGLNRAADTLSGGETQRIRLASQVGSGLTGVMYILDEPSIGLHQRDNARLRARLKRLRDSAITVSSSSTTRRRSGPPITSSISVRAPAYTVAKWSLRADPNRSPPTRNRSPAATWRPGSDPGAARAAQAQRCAHRHCRCQRK